MNQSSFMNKLKAILKIFQVGLNVLLLFATVVVAAMLLDDLNLVSIIIMAGVFIFTAFLWIKTV